MAELISIDELAGAIEEAVAEYTDDVTDAIPKVVEHRAREAAKDLRQRSPKLTGSYRKGWRVRKQRDSHGAAIYTIHNATDYQLTHLLEFGHAQRNGGHTSAYPHIAPVADEHAAKLTDELKMVVRNGGE